MFSDEGTLEEMFSCLFQFKLIFYQYFSFFEQIFPCNRCYLPLRAFCSLRRKLSPTSCWWLKTICQLNTTSLLQDWAWWGSSMGRLKITWNLLHRLTMKWGPVVECLWHLLRDLCLAVNDLGLSSWCLYVSSGMPHILLFSLTFGQVCFLSI